MKRIIIAGTALLITGLAHAAAPKPTAISTALTATTSTTAATAAANHTAAVTALPAATLTATPKPHSLITYTEQVHMAIASSTGTTPAHAAGVLVSQILYEKMPDAMNALKAHKETQRLHELLDQAGRVGIELSSEIERTSSIVAQMPEITEPFASLKALAPLFNKECQSCSELQKQLLASQTAQLKLNGNLNAAMLTAIEAHQRIKELEAALAQAQRVACIGMNN